MVFESFELFWVVFELFFVVFGGFDLLLSRFWFLSKKCSWCFPDLFLMMLGFFLFCLPFLAFVKFPLTSPTARGLKRGSKASVRLVTGRRRAFAFLVILDGGFTAALFVVCFWCFCGVSLFCYVFQRFCGGFWMMFNVWPSSGQSCWFTLFCACWLIFFFFFGGGVGVFGLAYLNSRPSTRFIYF